MLAITIKNPWAWAIIHAPEPKDTENRTRISMWERAAGQRIAIHTSKTWDQRAAWDDRIIAAFSQARGFSDSLVPAERDPEFIYGAIIGTVYLADVHVAEDCCDPWGDEQRGGSVSRDPIVHLELDHPRPCEPIPARGALGLWTVPAHVADQLEAVRR